jgi:hypothetical protein
VTTTILDVASSGELATTIFFSCNFAVKEPNMNYDPSLKISREQISRDFSNFLFLQIMFAGADHRGCRKNCISQVQSDIQVGCLLALVVMLLPVVFMASAQQPLQ